MHKSYDRQLELLAIHDAEKDDEMAKHNQDFLNILSGVQVVICSSFMRLESSNQI